MSVSCCVLGCYDRGKYSLPFNNPAIWKTWLKSCPYFQQYNSRQLEWQRICSKHFIPEHFDLSKNLLTEDAVPLLYLPKVFNIITDDCDGLKQPDAMLTTNETEEEIQMIVDESTYYDNEECIPFEQLEENEMDPLLMTPKESPIDFDYNEESVMTCSPPLEPDPSEEPPQLIEKPENSGSPIIKPQPLKVPRVVLQRLPPNLKRCRVCPPPLTPKTQPTITLPLAAKPQPTVTPPLVLKHQPTVTSPLVLKRQPTVTPGLVLKHHLTVMPRILLKRQPTITPGLVLIPQATVTPLMALKPQPTVTPHMALKLQPTVTPPMALKPQPKVTPSLAPKPQLTVTPSLGLKPQPTVTRPLVLKRQPTVTPSLALKPQPTVTPRMALKLQPTVTPPMAFKPQPKVTPSLAPKPQPTVTPSLAPKPQPTVTPFLAPKPQPTVTPFLAPKPQPTVTPSLAPKPQTTITQKKQNDIQTLHYNKPLRYSIKKNNLNDEQIDSATEIVLSNEVMEEEKKQRQAFNDPKWLSYNKAKWYFTELNLSSIFGTVLSNSQIRLTGETVFDGAKYTTQEKIFALSLAKLSIKGYNLLQKHLLLPNKDNIESILNDIPLRPGINDFIFQHLADAAAHKTQQEKECALLFSAMNINKFVKFNARTGIIEGFQDLGWGKRSNEVGDKALVFMLCGLYQLWKLPIAYYLTGDLVENNNIIFQKILTEVVMAVFKTGFVVKATVSDHSSTNVEAIKSFPADNDESEDNIYYEIGNNHIYHIYDLTNVVESLKSKSRSDNQHQNSDAKWKYLETVFQIDNEDKGDVNTQLESKAVEKITDLEFWNSALNKLKLMKFDVHEGETEFLPVNLFISNVKTTKKVWEDHQARGCAYVRRLNLKPLNIFFKKIREHERNNPNINSNRFIIAYRSCLINNLTSSKTLCKNTGTQDDKVSGALQNLTSPKKYSPYHDDVDLENVIYFVERISTVLPNAKALCVFILYNAPFKNCSQCKKCVMSPDEGINSTVWRSINLIDELLPEMVNIEVYPLILILQQEVDTSWFTCVSHKTIVFRIIWVFLIKLRAKKWCSYFNIQEGFSKQQFFIPTD